MTDEIAEVHRELSAAAEMLARMLPIVQAAEKWFFADFGTRLRAEADLRKAVRDWVRGPRWKASPQPTIVCLCGSVRFRDAFNEASQQESLAGKIVLTISSPAAPVPASEMTPEMKATLDELHLRKIDLAHEVLILNVGGYIGESTRNELAYARKLGKHIRFLEPVSE